MLLVGEREAYPDNTVYFRPPGPPCWQDRGWSPGRCRAPSGTWPPRPGSTAHGCGPGQPTGALKVPGESIGQWGLSCLGWRAPLSPAGRGRGPLTLVGETREDQLCPRAAAGSGAGVLPDGARGRPCGGWAGVLDPDPAFLSKVTSDREHGLYLEHYPAGPHSAELSSGEIATCLLSCKIKYSDDDVRKGALASPSAGILASSYRGPTTTHGPHGAGSLNQPRLIHTTGDSLQPGGGGLWEASFAMARWLP